MIGTYEGVNVNELVLLFMSGAISLDEMRYRVRLAELEAAALAHADTVDCGDFRLLLVPWQP